MSHVHEFPSFQRLPARAWSSGAPAGLPMLQGELRQADGATVRLLAAGDIGFSGRLRTTADQLGREALLSQLTPVLRSGDVVFGNLETPLLPVVPSGAFHTGETDFAETLAHHGFTLLNLANNHIYDHGPDGLTSSLQAVRCAGLDVLGAADTLQDAERLVRTDAKGLRIGWLGAARTLQKQTESGPCFEELNGDRICTAAAAVRAEVDVLVVSLHLGYMYVDYPHPDHRRLTHRLAAAGADLVLLHHAHVLQGIEVLPAATPERTCVVCHNLGNLLFDWQDGHVQPDVAVREQREGAIFGFDLDRHGVSQLAILPTLMHEIDGRVEWAVDTAGELILTRLQRLSQELQAPSPGEPTLAEKFHQQYARRNTGLTFKVLLHHLRRGNLGRVLPLLGRIRPRHALQLARWLRQRLVPAGKQPRASGA